MFNLGAPTSFWREISLTTEDYASSGPSSISYDVNMALSPSQKSGSPKATKQKPRTRSTSRGRPNPDDALAKILDLCQGTKEEVTKIRERLDTVTTDVAEMKEKVDSVQERMKKVEEESKDLRDRLEKLERKQSANESQFAQSTTARTREANVGNVGNVDI
jgi:chromosome segregation ATPase